MTSKITPEAAERCPRNTLQEQLEQVRKELAPKCQHTDQINVALASGAGAAWGGHHAQLVMPIDGQD